MVISGVIVNISFSVIVFSSTVVIAEDISEVISSLLITVTLDSSEIPNVVSVSK